MDFSQSRKSSYVLDGTSSIRARHPRESGDDGSKVIQMNIQFRKLNRFNRNFITSKLNRFNFFICCSKTSQQKLRKNRGQMSQRGNTMKRLIKATATLALALGFIAQVRAATSDSLTITITPNAFYAVDIDTASVSLNMGTVALAASTQTVSPSTVTIQSSYATTDLQLQGAIASAGTPWTFDADTSSQESDALAAWGTFTSVARSSAPAQSGTYFEGTVPGANSDVISTTNRYVGTSATHGADIFENESGFDSKDMDGLAPDPAPAAKSHLWLYFRLPNATTSTNAQNITITLTAVAPN
jgi:hypothetical protein